MTTNEEPKYISICDSCIYRVVRVLDISDEDADRFYILENDIEYEEDDESTDEDYNELLVTHELCALLHVDLSFNVKSCSAFVDECMDKSIINLDILKDI